MGLSMNSGTGDGTTGEVQSNANHDGDSADDGAEKAVDGAAEADTEEQGDGGAEQSEAEGEGEQHAEANAEHDELPKDATEAVKRAFGRKTAAAREARERAEAAERERDEIKTDAERLRSTVGNDVVMRAAQVAGIHPETITEFDARSITEYHNARAWRDVFDAAGDTDEGWTGQNASGQTVQYTPAQCRQQARIMSRQIEENFTARRAMERAGDEMKSLFEIGRAAKKAGITMEALKNWKSGKASGVTGVRAAGSVAATVRHSPPSVPQPAGARRSNSGAPRGSQNTDWTKVAAPGSDGKPGLSLMDAIQREEREKYRSG